MNLEELLIELRTSRLDDNVAPYLWSDEALTGFLNDAVRQVCIRQRSLLEVVNPDVCRVPFVAGQRLLPLHPSILAIRSASIERSDDYPGTNILEGITMARLSKMRRNWFLDTDYHCLEHWVPDVQEGYVALGGTPEHDGVLLLNVWRLPLEDERLEQLSDEPVINENWHLDLCDWAEYRAFSTKDAETLDTGQASKALASFNAKTGRLPSMTEIRIWGIQPITSSIPEFI